jgi:hypothetical protein
MPRRATTLQTLSRIAVLLVWALALWGALLLASAVADSFSEGTRAFTRLVPDRGATVWGWLAALSVVLALAAGLVGGALVASRWSGRGEGDT